MTEARLQVHPPEIGEFALTLSSWEGQYVEFKEAVSDSLAREMVAFANSGGGRIYVGVADDRAVKGVRITNRILSQVQDMARQCDPAISVTVVPFAYQGASLLMIDVREGSRKPYSCSAGYFLRSGPSSQKLRRDELVEFVRAVTQVKFEGIERPDFVYPRHFDGVAFSGFQRRAGIPLRGLRREHLLVNLGVARVEGKGLCFNNAGVLMFARDPYRFLPQSEVTCVLYRDVEGVSVIDRKDFRGNLLANLDDTMAFIKKHVAVRYEIKSLYRKEITELPEDALREAVVNALMHRDYHVEGARVMLNMFRDRVEVSDPGGLPPGLAPREFGKQAVHRNPLIADLLHRAGMVERIGSGVRRMRRAMRRAGLPAPAFEFGSFFAATFRKGVAGNSLSVVVPAGTMLGTKSGLSRDQVVVLEFCRTAKSPAAIVRKCGRSNRTKFRTGVLVPLIAAGLLAPTVPDKPRSRFQRYVTTSEGRARLV